MPPPPAPGSGRWPPLELLVFAAATAIYSLLAAPGVGWLDSGELSAAAWTLGGAHPPGHPAHALLGKLAAFLPLGEIGFRLNLLSAVAMGAALSGVVALARRLAPRPELRPALLAGAIGAVLAGLSPAALIHATRAEVYAPAAALLVWSLAWVLDFARGAGHLRSLLLAAFGCAGAAAFHPVIAATAALPMAIYAIFAARARLLRLLGPAALLGALALLSYAYLPLRAHAARPPLLLWGDPSSAAALLDLVTGAASPPDLAIAGVLERFASIWLIAGEWTALGALLGGLLGLGLGATTGLRGARVALAAALFAVAGAALEGPLDPDLRGHALPAILILAAGLAPLTAAAIRLLQADLLPAASRARAAAGLVVLLPLAGAGLLAGGAPALDRDDAPTRLYAHTVAEMPPGPGLYLTTGDHSLSAAQYERLVAGGRPDIAIGHTELSHDEWFLRHIKAQVPALYVPYIDDRVGGALAERLAVSNLRRGNPIGSDEPAFGRLLPRNARPIGRGFELLLEAGDAPAGLVPPPPLDFAGAIGGKVAQLVAITRGDYEARRGRFASAARAAGLDRSRFSPAEMAALAEAAPRANRPSLAPFLPRRTRRVLYEPWLGALFGDDLAWQAGLEIPAPPESAVFERRLHGAWRSLLSGRLDPGSPLVLDLGREAAVATSRLMVELAGPLAQEAHLTRVLERWPNDGGTIALLGSLAFNQGHLERAESLLRRAIELAPGIGETHGRLSVVLTRQGRQVDAQAAWQKALELDPSVARRLPPPTAPNR